LTQIKHSTTLARKKDSEPQFKIIHNRARLLVTDRSAHDKKWCFCRTEVPTESSAKVTRIHANLCTPDCWTRRQKTQESFAACPKYWTRGRTTNPLCRSVWQNINQQGNYYATCANHA